jgi:hypothetical protein
MRDASSLVGSREIRTYGIERATGMSAVRPLRSVLDEYYRLRGRVGSPRSVVEGEE